jgi:hypothetical protein
MPTWPPWNSKRASQLCRSRKKPEHALDMPLHDGPALDHGDLHYLVHALAAGVAVGVHAVDGVDEIAEASGSRLGASDDRVQGRLDLPHQALGDGLVDRLLRVEEAVDVGRAHAQGLGDVGDGGLLIPDFTEQPGGRVDDPLAGLDGRLPEGGDAHARNLIPKRCVANFLCSVSSV